MELILNILPFCSTSDIRSLGHASHRFCLICSRSYLHRIGIIKDHNGSTQVFFFGEPILPSVISFLCDLRHTLHLSLICDLFHASAFSLDIIKFLKNHNIRALEMLFLDDELHILENPAFSNVVQSILGALTPTCKRVSFANYSSFGADCSQSDRIGN